MQPHPSFKIVRATRVSRIGMSLVLLVVPLLAAVLVSMPTAALPLRLGGAYFAISSWVVAESCRLFIADWPPLGGDSGAGLPDQVIMAMASNLHVQPELAVRTVTLVTFVLRSRFSLTLTAIRNDAVAAQQRCQHASHEVHRLCRVMAQLDIGKSPHDFGTVERLFYSPVRQVKPML
jgi:ABC-type branched-subunit amino acid transport system permease subunit